MSEQFDEKLAKSFVGKYVLVGLTYLDPAGDPIEQRQMHGDILRVNPKEGIVIALRPSGQEYALPPDFSSFQVAPPGEYRLRSTGEVVVNPDLTCMWTITNPPN